MIEDFDNSLYREIAAIYNRYRNFPVIVWQNARDRWLKQHKISHIEIRKDLENGEWRIWLMKSDKTGYLSPDTYLWDYAAIQEANRLKVITDLEIIHRKPKS